MKMFEKSSVWFEVWTISEIYYCKNHGFEQAMKFVIKDKYYDQCMHRQLLCMKFDLLMYFFVHRKWMHDIESYYKQETTLEVIWFHHCFARKL